MQKKFSVILILILAIVFGCSSKSDKDYYQEAHKYLTREEYKKAVNTFVELLDKFPESPYAQKAALEIANLYHAFKVEGVSKEESLRTAIKYYKMCNTINPKNKTGANASFLSGFILANELHDYDAAKKTYREFIDKYPNNPMKNSAEIEIQNLGVDPEKIIEKQLKK